MYRTKTQITLSALPFPQTTRPVLSLPFPVVAIPQRWRDWLFSTFVMSECGGECCLLVVRSQGNVDGTYFRDGVCSVSVARF